MIWRESTDSLFILSDFTLPVGDDGKDDADGDGEGDLDRPLLCDKSAEFNLDVSSSIASIDEPSLSDLALRKADETVITFVASSKLRPNDSIVLKICTTKMK